MKNALLRAWYHRGAASLAGRSSLVPRATGSFPVSGVDEEHFTHTHHQGICSKPGSTSEVYANRRNEPSPEVFQITQFMKQLADSLFPLKQDAFTFSSSFEACLHTFQILHYKQR